MEIPDPLSLSAADDSAGAEISRRATSEVALTPHGVDEIALDEDFVNRAADPPY